ncbi:MAG TPA: hypothetical protein VFS14_01450, partial [Candidatus Saccharimonadales bacterium]|nr:hypothetical protein [Candidatus Saccharimonadales bacterium]
RRNFLARSAQAIDSRNRKREGWRKAYEAQADANWENTAEAHKIHAASARAALHTSVGASAAEAHFETLKTTAATLQGMEIQARANKLNVDLSKAKMDANWSEMRAGDARSMIVPENLSVAALANLRREHNTTAQEIRRQAEDAEIENLRKRSADRVHDKQFTSDLLENSRTIDGKRLLAYSGGIAGSEGESTVLSGAVKEFRSEYIDRITEKQQLIKHFGIDAAKQQKLALGENIVGEREINGKLVRYEFKADDDYAREAAIDTQLRTGSFSEVQAIIRESGAEVHDVDAAGNPIVRKGKTYDYRSSVKDLIKPANIDKKANFLGAQTIDDIGRGLIGGEEGLNMAAARSIFSGKINTDDVSGMKADALTRLFNVTEADVHRSEAWRKADAEGKRKILAKFHKNQESLKYSAWTVLNTPMLERNAEKESKDVLRKIVEENGITHGE